jgi:hypothetical protein
MQSKHMILLHTLHTIRAHRRVRESDPRKCRKAHRNSHTMCRKVTLLFSLLCNDKNS